MVTKNIYPRTQFIVLWIYSTLNENVIWSLKSRPWFLVLDSRGHYWVYRLPQKARKKNTVMNSNDVFKLLNLIVRTRGRGVTKKQNKKKKWTRAPLQIWNRMSARALYIMEKNEAVRHGSASPLSTFTFFFNSRGKWHDLHIKWWKIRYLYHHHPTKQKFHHTCGTQKMSFWKRPNEIETVEFLWRIKYQYQIWIWRRKQKDCECVFERFRVATC